MKQVVVTGIGIVSCLGNNTQDVTQSLKNGTSGIRFQPAYEEMGLRSHVAGCIDLDLKALIDRKVKRFMGDAAAYSYLAMQQAIEDAGLEANQVTNPRTGLIMGSGGASTANQIEAVDILRARGVRKVGPYRVPRTMSSTVSACLATAYKIKGVSYSISSACATSTHCIGHAMEQIQMGKQDIVFAGGGEEEHWSLALLFDAMGALSSKFNATPEQASRPYDRDRDGFIISGGGAVLVLEEKEHAIARGANIWAELVGYGATSDGASMVVPEGSGALRCMQQALSTTQGQTLDYINTHGTSTPMGDTVELKAIKEVFGEHIPPLSSSKSLAGHSLGAVGAQEAIYCLLMLKNKFLQASANIEHMEEGLQDFPIITSTQHDVECNLVMSNSFGFGGTNASLVFQRYQES